MNDRLDEARLAQLCAERKRVGRRIRVLESTASTNDDCRRDAESDGADGLTIFAEVQTAGRGQRGRVWHAPPRTCLLFSCLLRGPDGSRDSAMLAAWSALSVCEALEYHCRLAAQIRWPNDVYVRGRKIAGILVERKTHAVVGIGLNVNLNRESLPTDCRVPPTAVLIETGAIADRTALAAVLLERLDSNLALMDSKTGVEQLLSRWRERSLFQPGDVVAVSMKSGELTGRLDSLCPETGLSLTERCGRRIAMAPAEVISIQPAVDFESAPPPG